MPAGIAATVEGGYATIDFIDPAKRGPSLKALIDLAGPDSIETITRRGPRRQYRVLVGNAQAAGLLDGDEVARVPSAGQDSGKAAALVAADPNVNATADNAGDWHTPVDQHTSRNKFVGATTSAQERAMTPPRFTGTATPFGGSKASDTPTHREVIDHVKASSSVMAVGGVQPVSERAAALSEPPAEVHHPGHQANAGLSTIQSVEPTDPQGATVLPADLKVSTAPPTDTGAVEQPTGALAAPKAYPDGEPTTEWKRSELDAYAAASPREIDTTDRPNKQAVIDAIAAREAELNK